MFGLDFVETLKLLAPIILIEFSLKLFCFYRLSKDEVKYFPKIVWFFIILLITTFGSLGFLIFGRNKE